MPELIPQDFIDDLVQRIDVVEVIAVALRSKKQEKNTKDCALFTLKKHLHLP